MQQGNPNFVGRRPPAVGGEVLEFGKEIADDKGDKNRKA